MSAPGEQARRRRDDAGRDSPPLRMATLSVASALSSGSASPSSPQGASTRSVFSAVSAVSAMSATTAASAAADTGIWPPEASSGLPHFELHVAVCGAAGVGKTALIRCETEQEAPAAPAGDSRDSRRIRFSSTVYVDELGAGRRVRSTGLLALTRKITTKVTYWDVPSAEDSLAECCRMCSGCAAVLYVVDATQPGCLEAAEPWVRELAKRISNDTVSLVLINKSEDKQQRQVRKRDVASWFEETTADAINVTEVSAATGLRVNKAFQYVRESLLKKLVLQSASHYRENRLNVPAGVKVGSAILGNEAQLPRPKPSKAWKETATSSVDWL